MSNKEQAVSALLSSRSEESSRPNGDKEGKKKVLIEEVGETSSAKVVPVDPDEGPSLMEQMMAAQQQAKKKEDKEKAQKSAKEEKKKLGDGFKKGFLGGSSGGSKNNKNSKGNDSKTRKQLNSAQVSSGNSVTAAKKDDKEDIPTLSAKSSNKGLVLDDVQKALKEEEDGNPLLKQLQGGEWANDDLMSKLQKDPVLLRGLQNPKCQAAMQLMQSDPKEAKKRFEKDPEVSAFMQAFAALMADHFTRLGQQQDGQQQQKTGAVPTGNVEVGPLHAQAVQRQKQQGNSGAIAEVNKEEDERVKEIVQDKELRDMLIDPKLQQILQECNDPIRFQAHMRDPVTAYKIRKLYDAGLVGTAK